MPTRLAVGAILVPNRVFLAPMSGVTDAPFRRLAQALGAGLVLSEMTASEQLVQGAREATLRARPNGVGIRVVQLAGCEAKWMAEGARVAEASGAQIIDINMGCPAKRVTNGYAGSALMRDEDKALNLIEATVKAVSVPVTLKIRLGWDERSMNAPTLARRAESAGIKLITVHGRTRCQFYSGRARWSAIRAVKRAVSVPVVVNGDIATFEEVKAALAMSGADAVMIGRGAQGRPWLLGQLARRLDGCRAEPAPSLAEQFALVTTLYQEMLVHYGMEIGVRHARKHLGWALNVAAAGTTLNGETRQALRTRVLTADRPAAVMQGLSEAYDAFAARLAA
jgi:tRNA-dihydrouridine synthase B